MTDRAILFSAPMIRSLIAGTKRQTRRLIPQATQDAYSEYDDWCRSVSAGVPSARQWESDFYLARARFKAGDRLWCRESITRFDKRSCDQHVWYRAGHNHEVYANLAGRSDGEWPYQEGPAGGAPYNVPSIFMPRWASRLTLAVTEVRVQRLQDIGEEDAWAEGVCTWTESRDKVPWGDISPEDRRSLVRNVYGDPITAYSHLWETLNGADSWRANPWVAAISFDRHHTNIDAMQEAASPARPVESEDR